MANTKKKPDEERRSEKEVQLNLEALEDRYAPKVLGGMHKNDNPGAIRS